jgi:hypothetical protein
MIRVIVFLLCFSVSIDLLAQEKDIEKEVFIGGIREIMPIIEESCDNSNLDLTNNCTIENLQKFIASFEFETTDTIAFKYKCYVGFVVEANCSISSIEMKRSNGKKEFNEQVLAYFDYLPEFYKPGYMLGKPIATSYVVPLTYIQE